MGVFEKLIGSFVSFLRSVSEATVFGATDVWLCRECVYIFSALDFLNNDIDIDIDVALHTLRSLCLEHPFSLKRLL